MMSRFLPSFLLASLIFLPAQDAARIARAIESRYRSTRTLRVTFLERYTEGGRALRLESGTAFFSRPGRMRWEYEEPEKKLFLLDGKRVWFYVPADRTVTRSPWKESADWHTPLALLTGKARLGKLCGRLELAAQSGENHVLRCLPAKPPHPDTPGAWTEVILEVDRTFRLSRLLVRGTGGVETEFRFADWRENELLPEVLFHFQPLPGVAIVDDSPLRP